MTKINHQSANDRLLLFRSFFLFVRYTKHSREISFDVISINFFIKCFYFTWSNMHSCLVIHFLTTSRLICYSLLWGCNNVIKLVWWHNGINLYHVKFSESAEWRLKSHACLPTGIQNDSRGWGYHSPQTNAQ